MDRYRILVKGVVQNEGKYLVVRKWYDDRVSEPYQWEFIDGEVDFGEEPDKAVLRAIYEQTGQSAAIDRILYTWTFVTGDVFNIGISYLCRIPFDEVILSEDLMDHKWIKREEMNQYLNSKVLGDIDSTDLQ